MARPLSVELRKKIVDAYERSVGTINKIADIFGVSPRSVRRYLKLYRNDGNLSPKPLPGRPPILTDANLSIIKDIILSNSDGTLHDYCSSFKNKTGIEVTIVSIHNACKKLNIRRKKRVTSLKNGNAWMYK